MKKFIQRTFSEKGFTLIEIIATITIAAILASVLISFMGNSIINSAAPVNETRNLGSSIGAMEGYTAAYRDYLSGGTTWSQFRTVLGCSGTDCLSTCCPVTNGNLYSANFQTLKTTVTSNNQTLVAYFTEHVVN